MSGLNVTIVQADLAWEDIEQNRQRFADKLNSLSAPTDVVILPEMFSTGFSMEPAGLAEPMEGPTMQWMNQQAERLDAVVTGSLIIQKEENYYNRLVWMKPDGHYEIYDKRHLFRLTQEPDVYTAGEEQLIVTLKGWKICPQICYDLRFPVWNRNHPDKENPAQARYDLIFFNANWPQKRMYAWNHLLKTRAIENQSYVIGVNRVGNDGNDVYHSGNSAVIDPLGHPEYYLSDQEGTHTVRLSQKKLQQIRQKFQFLMDADSFTLQPQSKIQNVNS